MTEQLKRLELAFNALSTRERVIISFSLVIAMVVAWWNFIATPLIDETQRLQGDSERLQSEIKAATLASQVLQERLRAGVHKDKFAQIEIKEKELARVNKQLDATAYELIEPERMFELLQQLVFADSRLKLSRLSRKSVEPVFGVDSQSTENAASNQPSIYRHTMSLNLEGGYADILRYVKTVEQAGWKLIWDSINLRTREYPVIQLDLEISTLSKSRQWVAL